jgi:hypothetical protein
MQCWAVLESGSIISDNEVFKVTWLVGSRGLRQQRRDRVRQEGELSP